MATDAASRDVTVTQAVGVTPTPTRQFALYQNQPNPFNPTTVIRFELPDPTEVSLRVFDAVGRLVVILVDGMQSRGVKEVMWDGRDLSGNRVGSGVYFYRLRTGTEMMTRKMVMVK